MAYQFVPLQSFDGSLKFPGEKSPRVSQYIEGLVYTVRDGNATLHAAVQKWAAEGKVRIGGVTATGVTGTG